MNEMAGTFSGGMKRRLSVAISLIGNPLCCYLVCIRQSFVCTQKCLKVIPAKIKVANLDGSHSRLSQSFLLSLPPFKFHVDVCPLSHLLITTAILSCLRIGRT